MSKLNLRETLVQLIREYDVFGVINILQRITKEEITNPNISPNNLPCGPLAINNYSIVAKRLVEVLNELEEII
jgi:hypothetical protein